MEAFTSNGLNIYPTEVPAALSHLPPGTLPVLQEEKASVICNLL